jgi:hypothetical protein
VIFVRVLQQVSRNCTAECFKFNSLESLMKIFHYEWPCSVAGIQVRDSHVKCSQAPSIKPESSKAASRDFRRNECAQCQSISQFPISHYNILPEMDTWRSSPRVGFGEKMVSVVVWCLVSARRSDFICFRFDEC